MINFIGLAYYLLYLVSRGFVVVFLLIALWEGFDTLAISIAGMWAMIFALLFFSRAIARIIFGGSADAINCPVYQAEKKGEKEKIRKALFIAVLIFLIGSLLIYFVTIPIEFLYLPILFTMWRNWLLLQRVAREW
jgi:MFS family permease